MASNQFYKLMNDGVLEGSSLSVSGNAAVTGNVTVTGTATVTGASTLTGAVSAPGGVTGNVTGNLTGVQIGTTQNLSGAGAVNVTATTTKVTTTGANALTLANGTDGQIKVIVMVADGGDGTLTPTTKTGYSTITFNDVGDAVILQYFTTLGWMIVANYGCTVAP